MNGLRFIEKLASEPWLCDPAHVEFMHGIALRYLDRAASGEKLDVRSVEQATGTRLDNTRSVTNKDGVARIPVEGTIVRRASLFSEVSGMVSTETIAKDFVAALNDASVHSILFVFDTPGGEAYGINELATLIREKRGEKPIEAFCDGMCASAGYYLASATERITAEPTASVGSIGMVVRVFNPSAAGKSPYLEFVNARSPNKRPDPNTAAGRTAIQGWIDDMGDEFIRFVAESRDVSFEKVEQDFGQGFVMTGKRALAAGMVDALGSEGEVVGRLQEEGRLATKTERRLRPVAAHAEEPIRLTIERDALARSAAENTTQAPIFEEASPDMSENATQTTASGPEGTDAPTRDETRETGFMAHMRKFFVGEPESAQDAPFADEPDHHEPETREEMAENMTETKSAEGPRADAATREEVEALRAELARERKEKTRANASLREQGIDRMLAGMASYEKKGKRYALAPASVKAAKDLIGALSASGEDAVEISASGDATLRDNPAGNAIRNLLANGSAVETGERGTAAADAVGVSGVLARHRAAVDELRKSHPDRTDAELRAMAWEQNPQLEQDYEREVSG